jgi:hypothetical protein
MLQRTGLGVEEVLTRNDNGASPFRQPATLGGQAANRLDSVQQRSFRKTTHERNGRCK